MEYCKKDIKWNRKRVMQSKIGIDLVTIAEDILNEHDKNKDKTFDELYGFKRALEETRKGIREIAENKTVIITVDELDRCLPLYAIKILERLHHIFYEIENVIVIISIDKEQLEKSIKEIYGDITVDKYLRKFFSFELKLDNGEAHSFVNKYATYTMMFDISELEKQEIEDFLKVIFFDMDMRTQEQIFRKAEIVHKLIKGDEERDASILLFEILYVTIALRNRSKDMKWLINNSHNADVANKVTPRIYTYLQSCKDLALNKRQKQGELYCINDTLIGKTFFWIANIYSEYNEGECSPFYYSKMAKNKVEIIKRFVNVYDIIGCV